MFRASGLQVLNTDDSIYDAQLPPSCFARRWSWDICLESGRPSPLLIAGVETRKSFETNRTQSFVEVRSLTVGDVLLQFFFLLLLLLLLVLLFLFLGSKQTVLIWLLLTGDLA